MAKLGKRKIHPTKIGILQILPTEVSHSQIVVFLLIERFSRKPILQFISNRMDDSDHISLSV